VCKYVCVLFVWQPSFHSSKACVATSPALSFTLHSQTHNICSCPHNTCRHARPVTPNTRTHSHNSIHIHIQQTHAHPQHAFTDTASKHTTRAHTTRIHTHSQRRASVLQWNPEVATQLVVASDDDRSPTLQMWDLRNSVSPLKEFVGHSKVCVCLCGLCDRKHVLWVLAFICIHVRVF